MFKDPLEQPQQRGGPIISHGDIKGIFANIPDILAVHQTLVVRGGECLGRSVCVCVCVCVCEGSANNEQIFYNACTHYIDFLIWSDVFHLPRPPLRSR